MPDPYQRLTELGLVLPTAPVPVANFVPAKRHGDLLFLSGQGPRDGAGVVMRGKVGSDVSADQAYEHAGLVALNLLAVIDDQLGSLNRVAGFVKILGLVNALLEFTNHPAVINGCSDLLCAVFGADIGSHARSAIGVGSLPGNISVEIEAIVAVAD